MELKIKIMSYNIHKGFSLGNRDFVLKNIKNAIKTLNPDLVFLQEVVGGHSHDKFAIDSWPTTAQFEFLADEVWSHYAYGHNAVYTKGHHGNAILSKYPITKWQNIDLSTNPLEKRGLLHASISIPNRNLEFHALCSHLNLFEKSRLNQIDKICKHIEANIRTDEKMILCGDFNDWRGRGCDLLSSRLGVTEVFKKLHGRHAKTFPSVMPMMKLDRIYYSNLNPLDAECISATQWGKLSDHLALVANFHI